MFLKKHYFYQIKEFVILASTVFSLTGCIILFASIGHYLETLLK